MKFDTLSLLFVLFLACSGLSCAMMLAWRFLLPLRLLRLWAIGIGIYGSGILLILLREQIPGLFSLVVANLLVIGCYGLFWVGISLHCNKKPHYGLLGLVLLLFVPIQSWYSWVIPDIAVRTALIRIILLVLLGAGLATLLRNRTAPLSRMERALVATLLFDGCFRLFVLCFQLVNFSHKLPILQNMVATVSSMTTLLSMIAWAMVAVLLALEQANQELQLALVEREEQVELNRKQQEHLQALLNISQYQASDMQELLDFALQKVIEITGSQFGYIYHYHEDSQEFVLNSWSKEVMPACSVASPQTRYHLEKTGIWGEAVRQRRPIMVNDFAAENPLKKGYPEGHVHLDRFLTVPVFDGQTIIAVVGVANKTRPYTEQDVLQLDLMMAEVWRIAKRIELETKLIHVGKEWQTTFDAISDSVALIDRDQRILRCNQASTRLFGRDYAGIINHHCYELVHGSRHLIDDCPMQRSCLSRRSEGQLIFEKGRWLHVTVDPLLDDQGEVSGAVHIVHDDTERVLAEQSRLELLSMLETVQNELYVFQLDSLRFEYVNQSAQRNLGYSMAQLEQMTPLDLKTEIGREEFVALLAPLISGEKQLVQYETTHHRADGSRYPVEVNLQMVETCSGKRFLAVIHDITARKKAEQHLQDALQEANHFRAALDCVNAYVYIKDLESRYVYANRATLELFGCSAEELPGSPDSRFFPPETVEQVHQIDQQVFSGKRTTEEVPVVQPDGSIRVFLELKTPFYADAAATLVSGLLGISTDVTELKQTEQALAIQRERLENASTNGNIALWDWDIASGRLEWSSVIDRMLQLEPGTFPRTIEAWRGIVHPDDIERVSQALAGHLEQNSPYELDYRVRTAGGEYIYWHVAGSAYRNEQGQAVRMTGSCVDMTRRNRDEQQLRDMQVQLLQQEKLASVGQLSAGIAHEINNPMGFINSNLDTLGKYVVKFERYIATLEETLQQHDNPAEQQAITALRTSLKLDYVQRDIKQLLAESVEGAERVMRIVKDLKAFARSDAAQNSRADLNQNLDSTINIIWNQIKYVAELLRDYGELPKINCNIQQINQVFMNLLINATHAIEAQGNEGLGVIRIKTWADDSWVYITISDSGCGIPEGIHNRIFDPFFTTKEVGKGTGLGLSISHEIVRKHGGDLLVESSQETGTTFTVQLPLEVQSTEP